MRESASGLMKRLFEGKCRASEAGQTNSAQLCCRNTKRKWSCISSLLSRRFFELYSGNLDSGSGSRGYRRLPLCVPQSYSEPREAVRLYSSRFPGRAGSTYSRAFVLFPMPYFSALPITIASVRSTIKSRTGIMTIKSACMTSKFLRATTLLRMGNGSIASPGIGANRESQAISLAALPSLQLIG